jgi:DNA-binding transcriptional LysR family regulator
VVSRCAAERGFRLAIAMKPYLSALPSLELRLFRYVIAVAEELNFTRAAARLHLAAPSLSRQIRQLEDALGYTLFEPTTRATTLTPAGAAFVTEAKRALACAQRAVEAGVAASGSPETPKPDHRRSI